MKTYKLFSVIAILALLFAAMPLMNVGATGCTTTLNPGDDIQAAISLASSGDVICLNPGVYSPTAKININQSVTLQGPQAGVDPRPSAGSTRVPGDSSTEAIIDGASGGLSGIIVITADNVILDGLEVRNGSGDLVDSESSIPTIGTIMRYNIINNATGDEGMQIRNTMDGLIEYNYLFNIAQDGINMCCGSTGGLIQYNEVHDNYSENAAIYVYEATNTTVSCNLIYNVFGNDGIKLGSKGGGDATLSGGNILYNTVHNTAQDGITVYTSDTRVEGNQVYNSSSENGAIYVAWAVSNVTIVSNEVHDNTLDTSKWGDPGAVMIGSAVDAATVTVNDNNIYGNVVNGVTNKAVALLDAVNNWWGDAAGPGSGDTVSANVDFDPWLSEPVVISGPCVPNEPPVADANGPYLVAVEQSVTLDGSGSYDPDEDPLTETWAVTGDALGTITDSTFFTAGVVAGITEVTLTVDDGRGETATDTAIVVVYDPNGGFVTGGGWIDSPEGAYHPDEYPSGENFFLDMFDSSPTLSDTNIDGAWYPDRYQPAAFESIVFDGNKRLHVAISAADYLPHGSTFYNYQGRKFNLWNDLNTYITADLYIGADWEDNQRHASMWATTYDADGIISGYPIAGFTAGTGFRIFTQDIDQDTSNGYQAGWYDIGYPSGFEYGSWYTIRAELTETAYRYYINGELVWSDSVTFDSVVWANMMLQAYNYGEDYDVYWDNVGAGRIGDFPTGKATFGFVSKYKKGADVPDGNTEFQFKAGDLNFHSTSYDWLVVTGSDFAKFKGTGTINGEGAYKFQIWAGDNDPDTFRIKIWYEDGGSEVVVYDNGMNQEIGGGSIVVHTAKK